MVITDDASKMQEEMLDKATTSNKFELKEGAKETEMDKEWRQIQQNMQQSEEQLRKTGAEPNQHQQYPLKFNDDGTLSFYWFDAHEENYGADIYLFGKVWQPETKSFVSCSLKVQGMERTIFVYPKVSSGSQRQTMSEEEETALKQSMIMEFNNMRANQFKRITKFKCKFVSRKYCFEMPIPHGEHKFLKIKYSATEPPLPATLKGDTFECIFGAN
jgi:DNA polymerase alpha subunit A